MSNVISFEPRKRDEPEIYLCDCDNTTFRLYSDGEVQCANCGTYHPELSKMYVSDSGVREL